MSELQTLIDNIKREADRLQRQGQDIDSAYHDALVEVVKLTAEAQSVSPFEARLLAEIERIATETRRPVPTLHLCSVTGADYFAIYYHLRNLERRGLLHRPSGQRSGWHVA